MKKFFFVIGIVTLLALTGCASVTTYTPGGVTDNAALKVGEGPATGGIVAVAKDAGITKIATVDYRTTRTYWYWLAALGIPTLVKVDQTLIVSGE